MAVQVRPGDVLVTRSRSRPGWLIRVASALRDHPNLSNHVAVVHHADPAGTLWVIEGRPGGVGWRDAAAYLASRWTLTNAAQPKTDAQRARVCATMAALLGTEYDWQAIVADGAAALGWALPGWDPSWRGTVPGHLVCSSAAAYAYAKAGLPCADGQRGCTPGDWDEFILAAAWAGKGGAP